MLPLPIRDGRTTREDRATHFLICETLSFAIVASQYLCRIIHLYIFIYPGVRASNRADLCISILPYCVPWLLLFKQDKREHWLDYWLCPCMGVKTCAPCWISSSSNTRRYCPLRNVFTWHWFSKILRFSNDAVNLTIIKGIRGNVLTVTLGALNLMCSFACCVFSHLYPYIWPCVFGHVCLAMCVWPCVFGHVYLAM